MSPRSRRSIRSLAALLLGPSLLLGCSDSAVEEARSNREAVEAEAAAYTSALRGGSGGEIDSEFEAIASRLDPIARGGDPAANLLLARVRLDLGRSRLEAVMAEETAIAGRRSAAMNTLAAAAGFAASADDLRGVGFESDRRRLEGRRAAAEGGVSSSRTLLREIDGQTRIREMEIERLGRSVRAAEEQATGYRELAAREDVVGAPEFLELAAAARADAGRFRVSIADERSRLVADANRTPRHTRAAGDLAVSAADVDGSTRGLDALAAIDASIRRQAQTLAETAAALRAPVLAAAGSSEDDAILGGERLQLELDDARRDYAAAATAAGRVASSGDRSLQSSARVLQMNARFGELAADLLDVERLASEAALVAALGESASDATRLREQAEATRTRAGESLAAIADSIEGLGVSGATGRMLRAELAAAVDRLAGVEAAASAAAASEAMAPAGDSAGGPPFSSADALAAFIGSGEISNAAPAVLEQVLSARSRGGKRMLQATLDLGRAGDDIRVAMIETFGTAATSAPGGFGDLEGGEVVSRGDGEAEFGTGDMSVRLFDEDGVWVIDYEDMLAAAGVADPAALGSTAEVMSMASQQLGPFFRMFAQRIRNGEFGTADEANAAMTQAMAQAMMQAAGQAGGRR